MAGLTSSEAAHTVITAAGVTIVAGPSTRVQSVSASNAFFGNNRIVNLFSHGEPAFLEARDVSDMIEVLPALAKASDALVPLQQIF